ncbi:MAG: ParA family protein [Hyphomicrobiaceae bacterium]|nr:ParA family protein [Hyphomicrobiaceae bacterium]
MVAFVSQKGGVGKSTLARALATFAATHGLKTKLADLDVQQKTITVWENNRAGHRLTPAIDVEAFNAVKAAVAAAKNCDLLIMDTPGKIVEATTELSQHANLLVQPTSPSSDDLHIAVLLFLAMERVSIPRERLAFALCRTLSPPEEKGARAYLESFGYHVLEGAIPEELAYRDAMKVGKSIVESGRKELDRRAQEVMTDILRKAGASIDKKRARRGR